MDITTYEVRLTQWSQIMQECNASGLTKRQWCRENDIDEKQFYYWQRCIRKMVLQSAADANSKLAIRFAELPIQLQNCQPAYETEKPNKDFLPEMVLQKGDMTIKFSNRATNICYHLRRSFSYMLNNATGFSKILIACGYTDLRRGIDGLSLIIKNQFELDPFQQGTIFLFCGRRTDRMKALVWEEDGFLLLYKRLEAGKFHWPRSEEEIQCINQEQYEWLMSGMKIEQKKSIAKIAPSLPG